MADRFWDTVTIRLKPFIEICSQTAAGRNMITIDSIQELVVALSDDTIADPCDLPFSHSRPKQLNIQYNTMENLHSKTDKHTVSLI